MNEQVTSDDIRRLAPEMTADIDEQSIMATVDNAYLIALGDHFPRVSKIDGEQMPVRKLATEYLALHFIAIQGKTGQGVTAEKVDVLERHFHDTSRLDWLNSSKWGQTYLHLLKVFGGGRARYRVIQH